MSLDNEINVLNYQIDSLENTKTAIRTAIQTQGVNVGDEDSFLSYQAAIRAIPSDLSVPVSRIFDPGISTVSLAYQKVYELKHSTFDSTKITAVGSPTIDKGILSNISAANHVTVTASGYDMYTVKFTTGSNVNTQQNITHNLYIQSGSCKCGSASFTVEPNSTYYVDVKANQIKYAEDNSSYTTKTLSSNITLALNHIGTNNSSANPFLGTIDLKCVAAFNGNNQVFSTNITGTDSYDIEGMTFTIPYTRAITQSKIAEMSKRGDIEVLYSLSGQGNYYTIDEISKTVTLPKPDIYGMIEKLVNDKISKAETPHIVETYSNGTEWYRVYSDNWCVQGNVIAGAVEVPAAFTVTLLKPYKDTSYTIIVGGSHADTSNNQIGVKYGNKYYGTVAEGTKTATGFKCNGIGWTTMGFIA